MPKPLPENEKSVSVSRMIQKPPSISEKDFMDSKGYLLDREQREAVVSVLLGIDGAVVFNKGEPLPLPKGHPMYGQPLPYAVIKDSSGNIYAMNDVVLGKGGFAYVYVAQNILSQDSNVLSGNYYVLKKQSAKNEEIIKDVKKENAFTAEFGLMYGEAFDPVRADFYTVMPIIPGVELIKKEELFGKSKNVKNEKQHPVIQVAAEPDIDISSLKILTPDSQHKERSDGPSSPEIAQEMYNTMDIKDEASDSMDTSLIVNTGPIERLEEKSEEKFSTTDFKEDDGFDSMKVINTAVIVKKEDKEHKSEIHRAVELKKEPEIILSEDEIYSEKYIELQRNPNIDVREFDVTNWFKVFEKLAQLIEATHEKGILHLDIKPHNVMYDSELDIMTLFDFGLSQRISEIKQSPHEYALASPMFCAPEFFKESYTESLSTKQDVYALGKTFECLITPAMRELTNGQGVTIRKAYEKAAKSTFGPYFNNFQFINDNDDPHIAALNSFISLVRQMRNVEPENRPEASEVRAKLTEIREKLAIALQEEQNIQLKHSGVQEKASGENANIDDRHAKDLLKRFTDELENFVNAPVPRRHAERSSVKRLLNQFESISSSANPNIQKAKQLLDQLKILNIRVNNGEYVPPEVIYKKVQSIGNLGLTKPGVYATSNAKILNDICQKAIDDVPSKKPGISMRKKT